MKNKIVFTSLLVILGIIITVSILSNFIIGVPSIVNPVSKVFGDSIVVNPLSNVSPFLIAGTNVTFSGSGTRSSPLTINSSGGGGGLTVGTTTISGGSNKNILYDTSGTLGEYTVTGTGTVAAMQTSPTFSTMITTPKILGGTGATQTLVIQATSGNAVANNGADIIFKGGNNGGTELARIQNFGSFQVGTSGQPGVIVGEAGFGIPQFLLHDGFNASFELWDGTGSGLGPGANKFSIANHGVEHVIVIDGNNSDHVGIRTSSPGYTLDVQGDGNINAASSYFIGGNQGFTGDITAGLAVIHVSGGIITGTN
jgi:hypothetical protein